MSLTAANRRMMPEEISMQPTSIRSMVVYQREAQKNTWRPSPGRHLSYILLHKSDIIGLIHLASPVMNMRARDLFLGLPSHDMRAKGRELRHYMDLSVCVGIQPLAWHWNLGKLAALCAATSTVRQDYFDRYKQVLKGIITTSIWGRSSQYNRIYKHIGFSSGMGSEHVTNDELKAMRTALKAAGWSSNWKHSRMATIQGYRSLIEGRPHETRRAVSHGHKRGIYFHPIVDCSALECITQWFTRWGLPRYERTRELTPPYSDGVSGGRDATEERERHGTQRPLFF